MRPAHLRVAPVRYRDEPEPSHPPAAAPEPASDTSRPVACAAAGGRSLGGRPERPLRGGRQGLQRQRVDTRVRRGRAGDGPARPAVVAVVWPEHDNLMTHLGQPSVVTSPSTTSRRRTSMSPMVAPPPPPRRPSLRARCRPPHASPIYRWRMHGRYRHTCSPRLARACRGRRRCRRTAHRRPAAAVRAAAAPAAAPPPPPAQSSAGALLPCGRTRRPAPTTPAEAAYRARAGRRRRRRCRRRAGGHASAPSAAPLSGMQWHQLVEEDVSMPSSSSAPCSADDAHLDGGLLNGSVGPPASSYPAGPHLLDWTSRPQLLSRTPSASNAAGASVTTAGPGRPLRSSPLADQPHAHSNSPRSASRRSCRRTRCRLAACCRRPRPSRSRPPPRRP